MNKMIKYILIAMLLLSTNLLQAQDSLKANVFNVDKVLKPMLSESIKIQSNPNPEVPEIKNPVFEYVNIPDTIHRTTPTIYTIRPLSMGTSLLPKLKNNYTKFGFGNIYSPLLEVYLNSVRNKELQAGVFAKHFSSNPGGYNAFSTNTVEGFVKKFSPTGVLEGDVNYYRNNVFLYGFQPEYLAPAKSDVRQLFNTFELKGSYSNIVKDSSSILYKVGFNYYNFSDAYDTSENDFKVYADILKTFQGNPLEVKVQLNITDLKKSSVDYQRVYFDLNPRYTFKFDAFYLKVGFNSTIFSDSVTKKPFFFPVVETGYALIPKSLTAFGGITGDLKRNTYRSIETENPFVRNTAYNNTINNFEIYGGFKGQLGPQTSFVLKASWKTVQNQLFYAVDSSRYNAQSVFFDSTTSITNLKAELTHEFGDQFRIALTVNYYSYDLKIAHPYSRPTFETKLNAMYNIGDLFILKADIFTMNQRYAKVYGANGSSSDVLLKGLIDLNMGIDFRSSKTITFFLNFNNITNNTYQRWYGYNSYGWNLIGGMAVTF